MHIGIISPRRSGYLSTNVAENKIAPVLFGYERSIYPKLYQNCSRSELEKSKEFSSSVRKLRVGHLIESVFF
jgi:hypothetical protein